MSVELLIGNEAGTRAYLPAVEEGIEWSTERKGAPGKLVFKVLKDDVIDFTEGCPVRLKVDGDKIFFGFVFKQQRDKEQIITVTAYDQLRYLKNKDTKVYEDKTAAEFIAMLGADYNLNIGTLEPTGYVIESRVEENSTLFDMIGNALDLTLTNTGDMYILYDDFGKLTLKHLSSMYVGEPGAYLMIDEETGENFDYTSSIDDQTYNKIKLTYDNEDTGFREVYIAQDSSNMNKWGILQYFDTLSKGENGQAKADALLSLYNKKTRTLRITNALGDNRVRAGSMVVINLNLGDMKLKNWMEESGSCYMPAYSGVNVSSAHVNFIVAVGNADHINMEVSPAAVVTTAQCQANREKLCTAVLAYFDENSLEESFGEVFDGGSVTESGMSQDEITEAVNTEWNGESSQNKTAMSAVEVQEAIDTKWNGGSSASETAMSKEEIEKATT